MLYFITFLEGIVSFISPCMLTMLPLYISYFGADRGDRQYTLLRTISFIAGFTVVFTSMGLLAGTMGKLLTRYSLFVDVICGAVVIFLGICTLGIIRLNFGVGVKPFKMTESFFSAFIFGIIYSISLMPCIGAFLGSALMLASSGTLAWKGALLLIVYSLGLGIPFAISSLILESLRKAFDSIKGHYKLINTIEGLFLIAVGVCMVCGWMSGLAGFLSR